MKKIRTFLSLDSRKIDKFLSPFEEDGKKLKVVIVKALLKKLEYNENIIKHLISRVELLLIKEK